MSLEKLSEERMVLIDRLRDHGVFMSNTSSIRRGTGVALPKRRPPLSKNRSLQDYVPCQFCRQLFSKSHVACHQGKCKQRCHEEQSVPKRNRGMRAANLLMLPVGPETSEGFRKHILGKMCGD